MSYFNAEGLLYELCEMERTFYESDGRGEAIDRLGAGLKDIHPLIARDDSGSCALCHAGQMYNDLVGGNDIYFISVGVPAKVPVKSCPFEQIL